MSDLVPVRARDCACPGTPHEEGDIVFLLPKPSLALGLAWQYDISQAQNARGEVDANTVRQLWLQTYVRHGAVGWNLTDNGKPVPFSIEALVSDFELAYPVADKADDLYSEVVMRPLLARLSGTSQPGPTNGSIHPLTQSTPKRRKSSSPATSAASGN